MTEIRDLRGFAPRNVRTDRRGRIISYDLITDAEGNPGCQDLLLEFRCLQKRRCGVCGDMLGPEMAFIGDERGGARGRFFTPAMHIDCARYSFEVCPFIANPRWKARGKRSSERPDGFVFYITTGYRFMPLRWLWARRVREVPWGKVVVHARPAVSIERHTSRRDMIASLNERGGCPAHPGEDTGCPHHAQAPAAEAAVAVAAA